MARAAGADESLALQCAIYGSFSGPKTQEVVVSRGNLLELLRPDENGKVQIICSTNVFGVIRSLLPFSLAGTIGKEKQYIIVAGDSGRIVILEYSKERNMFVKIHQETFGKSGCRRIVPGQYLAVDPRGRACMIGAIEKQKLVYVLNRDAAAKLTISSPLEAHKSHNTCTTSFIVMDNTLEKPALSCTKHQRSFLYYSQSTGKPSQPCTKHSRSLCDMHKALWTSRLRPPCVCH